MIGDAAHVEALTFLFTDIESSTRLWEAFPEAMKSAVERHDSILRDAVKRAHGRVIKVTGDGFMAVFSSAADGATACIESQRALHDDVWAVRGRCGFAWECT